MATSDGLFGKQHVKPVTPMEVVIFTAVTAEAVAIRKAVAGLPHPPPVIPVGIAAVRPRPMLKGTKLVIMAGLAGALDPTLAVGEVVVDDPAHVLPRDGASRRGAIDTAKELLATPAAKAARFAETGAAAVDMEQAIVFGWAKAAGAACIGVRAISDTANESLDPALLRFVNEMGQVKLLSLLIGLTVRPSRVGSLLRLGRNAVRANRELGTAVRQIVLAFSEASLQSR